MNFAGRLLRTCNHGPSLELCRNLSMAKSKYTFSLKQDVSNSFDDGLSHRNHPGVRSKNFPQLPYKLQLAAMSIINKYRGKIFRVEVDRVKREFSEVMVDMPDENMNRNPNVKKINVDHQVKIELNSDSTPSNIQEMRKNFYLREPYNRYECAAYMASRLPANYAAVSSIFKEILHEEPNFKPSSLFDFGSGVGTTIWAADELWKGAIKEIFCVDLNENMNELSRELLQNGTTHCDNILDRTFYRQFLPVKHNPMYDLVVCSFSLLEFPDTRSRIYLVENLWKKTSGALVFVEHGTKAGFAAIMEARNFVLQISNKQLDPLVPEDNDSTGVCRQLTKPEGSVLAPCPHDFICPRQSALLKKSYCNFRANYQSFDYGQPNPGIKSEKFAYVVLKKNNAKQWEEGQKTWPRIVQPVVKKTSHTICRVCTSSGELHEIILSKSKNDRHMYRSARVSKWGDKLPANLVEPIPKA